jgi:plastocyanin
MLTTTSKTIRSRTLLAACIVLLAFAFAACSSSGGGSSSSSADITISGTKFPPSTSVKSGATVTVKNDDSFAHTVTSDDGTSFNITVDGGKTGTFTAPSKAGSFKFHCNIHSTMHGTLTVT